MKKILYGVSGIGNGHANRELPIISELAKDNRIVILCYGDSFTTFQREFGSNTNIKLVQIAIPFVVGSSAGLDFASSAVHPSNQNVDFTKINFLALDKVFRELGKPDLAISDYEPLTAQYAYSYNIPLVTIDQQSKFLHSDLPKEIAGFTYADEVHRLNMFFPKAASRIVCSFFKTQKRIGGEDVTFFPSPLRNSIKSLIRNPSQNNTFLVYISSARDFVQSPDEIVSVLAEERQATFELFISQTDIEKYSNHPDNIHLHPHGSADFLQTLSICDGVISTAGHSLLSECMYLGIPVYAIPVSPYEQHLNAKCINDNGFGISVLKFDSEKVHQFIDKLNDFSNNIKNDRDILLRGDGTEQIVHFLTKSYLSTKKIILFSPPFSGHLNVLKELIKDTKHLFDYHLVITGWKNIPPDLSGLTDIGISFLGKEDLLETDPALWTLHRADLLLEDAIKIVDDFSPDLIIYDFFSIEGYLVGRIKNLPFYCSLPAFIGPFNNQRYLKEKLSAEINTQALSSIKEKYQLDVNEEDFELVSDGLHLPGQINLIWSFKEVTRSDYSLNRSPNPYVFVGNLRGDNYEKTNFKNKKPLIYLSFGTVVMNNLWNRQEETRLQLTSFIGKLANKWKDKDYQVIFVTQGKHLLDQYPQNWWVYDHVDQVEILSRADVFITHGGSNSFHESLLQKVPMVVVPFFGDQLLVAKRVEELGLGINVGGSDSIDTHSTKIFLNEDLVFKIDTAVSEILTSSAYANKFSSISLSALPISSFLCQEIPLEDGDIIVGDNYHIPELSNSLPHTVKSYLDLLSGGQNRFSSQKIDNLLFSLNLLTVGQRNNSEKTATLLEFFSRFYHIHHVGFSRQSEDIISNSQLSLGEDILYYKNEKQRWLPTQGKLKNRNEHVDLSAISKVILTSEKQEKVNAVRETLGDHLTHIEMIASDPHIPANEQLVGMDEIISASLQRLVAIRKGIVEAGTMLISIVSGIVEESGIYHDVAVTFIQTPDGQFHYRKSRRTPLPSEAVKRAGSRGFDVFTVGAILSEDQVSKEIATDPQSYIYLNKITRTQLLSETLKKIFGQA